jgi:hypothetical protein
MSAHKGDASHAAWPAGLCSHAVLLHVLATAGFLSVSLLLLNSQYSPLHNTAASISFGEVTPPVPAHTAAAKRIIIAKQDGWFDAAFGVS